MSRYSAESARAASARFCEPTAFTFQAASGCFSQTSTSHAVTSCSPASTRASSLPSIPLAPITTIFISQPRPNELSYDGDSLPAPGSGRGVQGVDHEVVGHTVGEPRGRVPVLEDRFEEAVLALGVEPLPAEDSPGRRHRGSGEARDGLQA